MKYKCLNFAVTTLLFVLVFYQNGVGINLSLLTIITAVLTYYGFPVGNKQGEYWYALSATLIFALSFAWFKDIASFTGIFISMHWLAMTGFDSGQKLLKALILVPINYLMIFPNLASRKLKLSKNQVSRNIQIFLAWILLPSAVSGIFIFFYALSSSTLTDFFSRFIFDVDLNFKQIIALTVLGSIFMYAFWYFKLPKTWKIVSLQPQDNYNVKYSDQKDNPVLRVSGVITFAMLNLILLMFLTIYGYENFLLPNEINEVSQQVHERVYAVIASIVMAVVLILIFFKDRFNFNPGNRMMKKLTFGWILLNGLLIIITLLKNLQYVLMLGLTQKRLGVFAFLILSLTGLILTFKKVQNVRTNWYLFNRMIKVFYISLLLTAVINWSWIITKYNIETGHIQRDIDYHDKLPYNDISLDLYKSQNGIQNTLKSDNFQPELRLDGCLYELWVTWQLKLLSNDKKD